MIGNQEVPDRPRVRVPEDGPEYIHYAGAFIALAGIGVLFCQKLITPLRQQQQSETADAETALPLANYLYQQEYGLTFRLLFTPAWWAFTSVSAYRALRKLLVPSQRSSWDKTPHGHELGKEAELARDDVRPIASPAV